MKKPLKLHILLIAGFSLALFANWAWSVKKSEQVPVNANLESAIFAGGCFWCMEPPFDKLDGVVSTTSGYTGGHVDNPTYKQVTKDDTGHYEAVEILYDPKLVDYETLLTVFWHNVDPLTADGQFCDKGKSYRTAIFYRSEKQKRLAEETKDRLNSSGYFTQPIVTEIIAAETFYPAEDYHQDYYQKNPARYKYYRFACGRDKRLKELWGEAAKEGGRLIPTSN